MLNILLSILIDSEKQMSLTKIYANSYERSVFMTLKAQQTNRISRPGWIADFIF